MSYSAVSKTFFKSIIITVAALAIKCSAAHLSAPGGVSVDVDESHGAYRLSLGQPAWTFEGSFNVSLRNVATSRGHNALGDYEQVAFEWKWGATPMKGWIRLYGEQRVAVFSDTCGAAQEMPPAPFPAFTNVPQGLHEFSYGCREFAPPRFDTNEISTPWLLFDDQANALVISPASHYMVASMIGDGHSEVASGFNPDLRNVPAGFEQQTLVAFGNGINKTWDSWGRALLALEGAVRPGEDADTTLKYLGYWTDNGAAYYYNYDFDKGYAGTLKELVQRYHEEQIPIRYLQLDSWWYYKTTTDADGKQGTAKKVERLPEGEWNRYGGLLEYKAHPAVFPQGLEAFQKSIGIPLVTHNRWVDPASPYREHYRISGVAAVDPKWWDDIAGYLKTSGITTYEQDWLDRIFSNSPEFTRKVGTGEAFLDNMARACEAKGITLQYCMPYPCYFMQGSRYPNLTTIRTSGDRFNPDRWNHFLYTSRLASSLGIWPWTDVYMSTERGNVLLSTLSAGPVGIGDLMGSETKTNLDQAVRADGVIVKPDASMVPMDQSYIADAKGEQVPLTASTYTDRDGTRTEYVFAFNRNGRSTENVEFNIAELGLDRSSYVYDYFAKTARRLGPHASYSAPLAKKASAYYVVAPVGKSGIAFLGDESKFVGTGKQRIASVQDQPGKLSVEVVLAENEESVVLHGYSATAPKATITAGVDDPLQYDSATGHFSIEVKADSASPVDKSSGDPVRRVAVVLETTK
jgi:hypothetical protein